MSMRSYTHALLEHFHRSTLFAFLIGAPAEIVGVGNDE